MKYKPLKTKHFRIEFGTLKCIDERKWTAFYFVINEHWTSKMMISFYSVLIDYVSRERHSRTFKSTLYSIIILYIHWYGNDNQKIKNRCGNIQSTEYSLFRMPNIEYKCSDAHTVDVLLLRHYDTMALSHMIWLM